MWCVLYAAGAPWASRAVGRKRARFYPRNPHYPQAESAFPRPRIVTASGRGRDELPATEDRLPSHSRSGCPAGRFRAEGRTEAQGRAADEAAARRTMTGLPFSGCESGRLREAPTPDPRAFGLAGPDRAGHRTFGSKTCPGGTEGFGPRIRPAAGPGLRLWNREGRNGSASFRSAKRRTVRASGPVGEPAGKPAAASAADGLRRW